MGQNVIVSKDWSSVNDCSFKVSRLSDTQYWTDFRASPTKTSFNFSCTIYGSCTILFGVLYEKGQLFYSISANTGKITGHYQENSDKIVTHLVVRVIVDYNNPAYVDNLQLFFP